MKKKSLFYIGSAICFLALLTYFFFPANKDGAKLTTKVQKGVFEVVVTSTGELRSKNYTEVTAPTTLRSANIWQIKVTNLVAEGTQVKEGDFVAELDRTEIMNKINEEMLNVNKKQSEFKQNQLDTTLSLRDARDELLNLKYALEEKKLAKEQSIYEPPAVLRQAEIEYEKALRNLEQKKENYKTKREQSVAKMQIVSSDLEKANNKLEQLTSLLESLKVKAPKSGMIIYAKDWDGRKRVVGTTISTWDPVVANLPDLSIMESVTYVNEVDIQKIKTGQKVELGLDAQPGKKLQGQVKSVASIGEQKPNSEAKVFEVVIEINNRDTSLRPAMTTSNHIITASVPSVLSIPIESIHAKDGKSYVYKKDGLRIIRQEIKTGMFNETNAIVELGLGEGDEVYLSTPADTAGIHFETINAPGPLKN